MYRVVSCILLSLFGLGALLHVVGTMGAIPHRFIGDIEFNSVEEMQIFQSELITEAKAVGASVESFDLSVSSPPKVHYIVFNPSGLEFKYGEPIMTLIPATIMQIMTGLVILAALVIFSMQIFWDSI